MTATAFPLLRFPNEIRTLRLVSEQAGEYCLTPICDNPASCLAYMASAFAATPDNEQFWVVPLNRKNRALGRVMISSGTATGSLAHPREVFRAAIIASATAIVCFHNHPSGDPAPSNQDMAITRLLREAARVVDIALHDHLVIGRADCDPAGLGYYSFRASGML
jgi:DNA repair protein RadC